MDVMNSTASFRLIAGLTSSGKSTYSKRFSGARLVLASEVERRGALWLPDGVWLHYNTLRYAENSANRVSNSFYADPALRAIVASGRPFDTDYIFCSPTELLARAARRKRIEDESEIYPSERILEALRCLDLPSFHWEWLTLLCGLSRRVRLIHATAGSFEEVSLSAFRSIVGIGLVDAAQQCAGLYDSARHLQ